MFYYRVLLVVGSARLSPRLFETPKTIFQRRVRGWQKVTQETSEWQRQASQNN